MTSPKDPAGSAAEPIAPTEECFDALARPDAFPETLAPDVRVAHVQTHLSHVFLTEDRVYKFRKAVDLGFVDFTTPAERNADCLREITLNRRLAPDVYLGVAPLVVGERPQVGPIGDALAAPECEHCVVMRRLPDGRDALSLLDEGQLPPAAIDRIARHIAAFHEQVGLGRPAPFSPAAWLEICTGPFRDSLDSLAQTAGDGGVRARADGLRGKLSLAREAIAPALEARREAGAAVDGHGDLHLQHVWLENDRAAPVVIDCLEFSTSLRRIDAACDIAFAAMDLHYRERPDLAERLLRRYATERLDPGLYGVVDFFIAYRAAVRAKVAAIAARATEIQPPQRAAAATSAQRHLDLCEARLRPASPGALVLVGGVVGAGKSTLAEALAQQVERERGCAVLGSDLLRKRRAGAAPTTRLDGELEPGDYTPAARARIYAALIERAEPIVVSGRVAILDATWERRDQRREALALAQALGARCFMLEATCSREVAIRRLTRRRREGDPKGSDAGPELYPVSVARFEPWRSDEGCAHREVRTDRPDWREHLGDLAHEIAQAAPDRT